MKCGFDEAWIGHCQNDRPCPKHDRLRCSSCGSPATRSCPETGGPLVCGSALCDNCEHYIVEDGTNGLCGGAFPRGMHVPKGTQDNKPWYAQLSEDTCQD